MQIVPLENQLTLTRDLHPGSCLGPAPCCSCISLSVALSVWPGLRSIVRLVFFLFVLFVFCLFVYLFVLIVRFVWLFCLFVLFVCCLVASFVRVFFVCLILVFLCFVLFVCFLLLVQNFTRIIPSWPDLNTILGPGCICLAICLFFYLTVITYIHV